MFLRLLALKNHLPNEPRTEKNDGMPMNNRMSHIVRGYAVVYIVIEGMGLGPCLRSLVTHKRFGKENATPL